MRIHLKEKHDVDEFPNDLTAPKALELGNFLKDHAYSHEGEYRALFTAHVRNTLSLPEFEKLPETMGKAWCHPLMGDVRRDNSPMVFSVEVSSNFIEEICFDPRMPDYRRIEMLRMLGNIDIPEVRSDAFGCMVKDRDLTIPEDI